MYFLCNFPWCSKPSVVVLLHKRVVAAAWDHRLPHQLRTAVTPCICTELDISARFQDWVWWVGGFHWVKCQALQPAEPGWARGGFMIKWMPSPGMIFICLLISPKPSWVAGGRRLLWFWAGTICTYILSPIFWSCEGSDFRGPRTCQIAKSRSMDDLLRQSDISFYPVPRGQNQAAEPNDEVIISEMRKRSNSRSPRNECMALLTGDKGFAQCLSKLISDKQPVFVLIPNSSVSVVSFYKDQGIPVIPLPKPDAQRSEQSLTLKWKSGAGGCLWSTGLYWAVRACTTHGKSCWRAKVVWQHSHPHLHFQFKGLPNFGLPMAWVHCKFILLYLPLSL